MLMTKERLPAIRTLRGWAISVLQDAGAIRECEDHFALSARVHPSDIANDPESLYVLALIGGFDVERLYQSSLELLSSLRAAAVGGVGRCLKVVPRNCGLFKKRRLKPHIFLHIVDGERGTLPG